MKNRWHKTFVVAVVLALMIAIGANAQQPPEISAKSAILYDCTAERPLFEKNADAKSLIASTTKIMTGLLVAESCNLSDVVEIPQDAVGVEGSSLYLQAGEKLTVEELLYGLMLHSGNDAAVALAIHSAGSVETFVQRMNEKAVELHMEHSHFANPNGLDAENHYATARDLAVLTCYALKNETFAQIVQTKTITVPPNRYLTNHNKLLWRYDGCIGVKTGFTRSAGRILVSAAERDGRRLVAVTIDAPNDWNDHAKMLDYGFWMTVNGPE